MDENRNNIISKAPVRNQVLGRDDFGLRALAAQIEIAKSAAYQTSETSSVLKEEDLNFPGDVERHFAKPSYQYMESPFNNRVVGPLGDCNVPKEYLHRLGTKGALPDIYQNISKMATDLVSRKKFVFKLQAPRNFDVYFRSSFSSCSTCLAKMPSKSSSAMNCSTADGDITKRRSCGLLDSLT